MKLGLNLKQIKIFLDEAYACYKHESNLFKSTETLVPAWERKVGLVLVLISFISIFYRMFGLSINASLYDKLVPLILYFWFFVHIPMVVIFLVIAANRELNNVRRYYNQRKGYYNNLSMLTQKRYIFTTFTFLKTVKPVVKYCFACVFVGGSGFFVFNEYHLKVWPGQKPPMVIMGEIIREHTGYPPESWDLPEVKGRKELERIQEQITNQEVRHQQEMEELRKEINKLKNKEDSRFK